MSRGPYKRDERVLKDEQLLQTLREYTGRVENFEFQRLQEQQKLFAKFKQGMLLSLSLSLLCRRPYLSPSQLKNHFLIVCKLALAFVI